MVLFDYLVPYSRIYIPPYGVTCDESGVLYSCNAQKKDIITGIPEKVNYNDLHRTAVKDCGPFFVREDSGGLRKVCIRVCHVNALRSKNLRAFLNFRKYFFWE